MTDPSLRMSDLAMNYRQLVLCFGAQCILSPATGVFDGIGPGTVSIPLLSSIINGAYLVITLVLAYYGYQTARSVGSSQPASWAVGMLIPGISMLTLLSLSAKATAVCRERGIAVGLFGPRLP